MTMFKIIKRGANNFWHVFNNNAKEVAISDFEVVLDAVANTFVIVFKNGANVPSVAVNVLDIIVIDETDSSAEYTFANVVDLRDKLVILGYTAYLGAGNADSITGLVIAGTNVTITGSGTLADPYVINSSGGSGGSQNLQQTLNNGATAAFTHPLIGDTLLIEEVSDNSISYVSKKTATNSDGSSTTHESFSVGSIFKYNSLTQDNKETFNSDFNGGFSTIESDFNVVKATQIYDNASFATGNIVYELPTPKLGINVVIRDPVIETSGTYTRATREWVTANPPTIVVDADDVTETATRVFVTPTEKTAITHSNRSTLDLITEAFTTALKTAYDNAVSWISTNGTNVLNHLTRTDNPHSVTKSQVGLSNVDNTSDENKPVSTAQATAIGLKVDKTSWIDISATSTIVGFSSYTLKTILYKKIDTDLIQVKGHLSGTSNGTLLNFTIPFTSANNIQNIGIAGVVNNGGAQAGPGFTTCNPNSNVVNVLRDYNGPAFASTGTKTGKFSILIEIQ